MSDVKPTVAPSVPPCPCCDLGGLDDKPCPSRAAIMRLEKVLDAARFAVQVGEDRRRYPGAIEAVTLAYGYALDHVSAALKEYDHG